MSPLHLHILGTAGYHPCEDRHTSCYFIPEIGLMLDAGTGMFRAKPMLQTDSLDILLSHAHLDHVFGLSFVLDLLYQSRLKTIRVYGEQAKLDAIRAHLFHELLFPVEPPIEWIALENLPKPFTLSGAEVDWVELPHPGGSVGYRLNWPETSMAYVTDTTSRPTSSYWPMMANVDWLIHECNFDDAQSEFAVLTGHSWTSAVLAQAAAANVQNLILTHFNPLVPGDDPLGLKTTRASRDHGSLKQLWIAQDRQVIRIT